MFHFFSLINDLPLYYHYLTYFININLIEKMYDFFPVGVLWFVVFCTIKIIRNIILSISSKRILQMATSQYCIAVISNITVYFTKLLK